MIDYIEYNGGLVEIFYSKEDFLDIESVNSQRLVKGVGTSSCGDCQIALEIAFSYLVRNASQVKPHRNLKSIIIMNDNSDNSVSIDADGKNARYVLTGSPIFKKN